MIRAKGRVAVAACMKEGEKKWMMDLPTIYYIPYAKSSFKALTTGLLDVCGSLNYDVIIKWRSKTNIQWLYLKRG